jgi:hypothetical protein
MGRAAGATAPAIPSAADQREVFVDLARMCGLALHSQKAVPTEMIRPIKSPNGRTLMCAGRAAATPASSLMKSRRRIAFPTAKDRINVEFAIEPINYPRLTTHIPELAAKARLRTAVAARGGSRMRESRTYGSVRGALSNERPYRDLPFLLRCISRLLCRFSDAGDDDLATRSGSRRPKTAKAPMLE